MNVFKTVSGEVVQLIGKRAILETRVAARFDVDASQAKLFRKNGSTLVWGEVEVGDRLKVFGKVFSDNSMAAESIWDFSLYFRKTTVSGKITEVLPEFSGFKMQAGTFRSLQVNLEDVTPLFLNGSQARRQDIKPNVRAKVTGMYERDKTKLRAVKIELKARLVKIEIKGKLVIKDSVSLTVISGGVIYGVDIKNAILKNQDRQKISFGVLKMGGQVKVVGRHLSGDPFVIATQVSEIK